MIGFQQRLGGIHYAWAVVAVTFVALLAASGLRSSFGVFVKPLEAEFGWDRATISGVAATSMLLFGASQPIVGRLVDLYGTRAVMTVSLLLLGVGAFATALVQELWQLYLAYGLLVSLASGGPGSVPVSAIAARWFVTRRGLVVGIATAGISTGQLVLIPLTMWLTVSLDWRAAYLALATILCVVALPLVWLVVRDDPADLHVSPYGAEALDTSAAARAEARLAEQATPWGAVLRNSGFWLLCGSYFVCGYSTIGLVGTHVVPYAVEHGIGEMSAAGALGLMGAVNILGTIAAGYVVDRHGRRVPLALVYAVRGLSLLWLLTVQDARALSVFAVLFGLTYIATVPPTTALTTDLFGGKSVASIFGWIFLVHQLGAALGSLGGGLLYQATGGYLVAFFTGALACFAAAAMVLAIRVPVRPPVAVAAAA